MTFTDEQKAIINNERSIKYVKLEFPDHEINDIEAGQIYQESLELEESISENGNIVFGKCNGTLFKTRVADFTEDIEKAKMNVYVRFVNEDLGEVNVPFGKYIINQPPERTSDRRWRDITATDYMVLFDVDIAEWYNTVLYPSEETMRTVKYIREALCDFIGVDYEDVILINDNRLIGKSISPETLSGRDLLQNCCEVNACFGHFDWNGVLRWIQLIDNTAETQEEDIEYIDTFKNDGCQYEDYSVHEINSVAIIKEDGALAVTYEQIPVGEERNRYTITGNVLLYGLNQVELEDIAESIYNKVSHLSYRPNETEVFSHVYMPLGQLYEVSSTVIVGTEYIDTSFRSYMLKRTIKGIQSMFQTLESSGDSVQPETQSHDIMNTLTILQGKSAVYKRGLDALEIEYKDFEKQTESRFEQTSESIKSVVARNDESWDERGYIIYWKGYGLNNPIIIASGESRQPQVGDYYLDINTGRLCTIASISKREGEESDAILTESGSEILTESGEVIILESDNVYDFIVDYQYIQLEREKVYVESQIEQLPHTISLKINGVKDGSGELGRNTNVGITLSILDADGNIVDTGTGTITLNGNVIFTNDLSDGTTVISGNNIKTGTISADRLDVTGIFAENVTATGTIEGASITGASGEFTEHFKVYAPMDNNSYIWMDNIFGSWILSVREGDSVSSIILEKDRITIDTPDLFIYGQSTNTRIKGNKLSVESSNRVEFETPLITTMDSTIQVRSSDNVNKTVLRPDGGIELAHSSDTPYIDFHYAPDADLGGDYSVREILLNTTTLQFRTSSGGAILQAGAYNNYSSKAVKENIEPMDEEEAKKLLDVDICSFDFIDGWGEKNQYGVIAEEVNEIIPYVATIPDDWDEDNFDKENKDTSIPSVDYTKFTPYMIKLLQMQNKEIETMKDEIATLKEQVAFLIDSMKGDN